jgi:hypothetical protein
MRIGLLSVCAVSVVLAASLTAVTAVADTPPPTLYVSGDPYGNNCNDTGPGTYSQPLCHVQVAADIVVPGQTVIVDSYGESYGLIPGDVHITRSGTPDAPIVFKTDALPLHSLDQLGAMIYGGTNAFVLDGVHDVTIDGFGVNQTTSTAIVVANSSDITLNNDMFLELDRTDAPDAIDVTGTSSNVTISRSLIDRDNVNVSIGPGVTDTDVVDNIFDDSGTAVSVDGAANTDIVNNSVTNHYCPTSARFLVTGAATGTSLENNIGQIVRCSAPVFPVISVAADSTATTRSDYNIVYAAGDASLYSWGATTYASAAQFTTATGQGAHDLNTEELLNRKDMPTENSPAVDSADADAPGVLSTDHDGSAPIDDPNVSNTGTGVGYLDRGAMEMQDPMTLVIVLNAQRAPTGGTVVATLRATQGWAPITGYTVDFGDGTQPTASTSPTINHVYAVARTKPYQISATVTDSLGHTTTTVPHSASIYVVPPTPLQVEVSIEQWATPLELRVDAAQSQDGWSLASVTCDFGDGSPIEQGDGGFGCWHTYQAAGTYQITLTVTDGGGNTASGSQVVVARVTPIVWPGPGGGKHCSVCY